MSIHSCGAGDLRDRLLYSPKETEALLGISHATCYRLINAGKLDARKIGNKTVITGESILRLAAELPRAGRGS
jgi:predicted site-specific integrase-resolvase